MSELGTMLAAGNDPNRNEGTAYPWWLIIDPTKVRLCNYRMRSRCISAAITGPFFSREAAEERLRCAAHHYSKHAIVYCASGYGSEDWIALMKLARNGAK